MRRTTRVILAFALIFGALSVAGCTTNPATGGQDFTPFMSPAQEIAIGKAEHPRILQQFGGAYNDPDLQDYVTRVGLDVAARSELPDYDWMFTVLDSHVPNAFALPGGFVYVTRGLLAIINSEDELAGVLGHEIGHVTARHSAKRYSNAMGIGLGAAILGAAVDEQWVGQAAALGAGLYLASYSRKQEYQSDDLGVRYLARAGSDPYAQADILHNLGRASELEAKALGQSANAMSFFSTHPNTPDRVVRATQKASVEERAPSATPRRVDAYLNAIDNMDFGANSGQGLVAGREFYHAGLGITFEVPEGFKLANTPQAVLIEGPNGAVGQLDIGQNTGISPLSRYLQAEFGQNVQLENLRDMQINGMRAASATAEGMTQQGARAARFVVFESFNNDLFRFQFVAAPEVAAQIDGQFKAIARSFRAMTDQEIRRVASAARYLDVVTVQRGDTIDSLADRMAVEFYKKERFMTLNGLEPGEQLTPGQRVKIVR